METMKEHLVSNPGGVQARTACEPAISLKQTFRKIQIFELFNSVIGKSISFNIMDSVVSFQLTFFMLLQT